MRPLRIVLRLAAITATCLAFYLFLLATSAGLALWQRARGDRRGTGEWRTSLFHAWSRCMVALLGVAIVVRGRPPRSTQFLVANHLSYVDVIVIGSQLRCVFVAKAEVASWPLIGRLCRSVDTVFIDRENKRDIPRVMQRIEAILSGGRSVVVFPEGTSSRGVEVMRFRPSLLETAARSGRPVGYAVLSYATAAGSPPAQQAVCWWGGMPFGPHVLGLLGLRRIRASLTWGEEPIADPDRKALARRLRDAVERQFQPVI